METDANTTADMTAEAEDLEGPVKKKKKKKKKQDGGWKYIVTHKFKNTRISEIKCSPILKFYN